MPEPMNIRHISKPDRNGDVRVHTDRYTLLLEARHDHDGFDGIDGPAVAEAYRGRIFADSAVLDQDPQVAELSRQERELDDLRMAPRGMDPDVDSFYDKYNRQQERVYLSLTAEILSALPQIGSQGGLDITGNLDAAAKGARTSFYAGCATCKCTPGVICGSNITLHGAPLWIHVFPASDPPPDPETIPEDLLDELTTYAIDEDGLDITLDDARGGHYRAEVYREIARRAYAAGVARGQSE